MNVVGASLRRMGSLSIPIDVLLVLVIYGTSSQPVNLDVSPVTSPTPHFSSFPESIKFRGLDLH